MTGGGTIELFSFIQKVYQDIGIFPPKSNQSPKSHINLKNWFILFCLVQFFISTAAFLFHANSMIEYGMVFFACTTTVLSITVYLIIVWQMKNILKYIENCERFVEKSEY